VEKPHGARELSAGSVAQSSRSVASARKDGRRQSASCYLTRNAVLAGGFRMQLAFSYPLELPLDEAAQSVPEGLGVIRIDLDGLPPYLGQARNLRRRMARLRGLFGNRMVRATYQPAGSSFEARIVLWRAAR